MSEDCALLIKDICIENEEQPNKYSEEPSDKYKIVYCILYLLGIAYDLPITFFTTANNYWMYKFRDINRNNQSENNPTSITSYHGLNLLQTNFTAYINFIANISLPIFCLVNLFINQSVTYKVRITTSLTVMLILFCTTTSFINVNTDSWQHSFFLMSLILASIVNACTSILFSCFYGIVSKFPPSHIISFTYGQSMGKIIAAVFQAVSLTIGNSIESALVYFSIGCFIILLALISSVVLSQNTFYNFYLYNTNSSTVPELQRISRKKIFRKIYPVVIPYFLNLFITYFVFPGVTVLIKSYDNSKWGEIYFSPVISFFVFFTADYIGRYMKEIVQWPENNVQLNVLSFSRLILIPLILFCNVQPRRNLLVIFNQDFYYKMFITLLGTTHGFLINATYIAESKMVEQHKKDTASILTTFLGTVGMVFGSLCSILVVKYI